MKSYCCIILVLNILALCICCGKETKNIRSAVLAEMKKYPKLQIQDLYKLAYQAAMGNEHLMSDTAAARKYLEDELAAVDTLYDEPLIEYIVSDSSIARVNLRAMKKQKINSEKLFNMMILTASSVKQSTELLRQFWSDVEKLAEDGCIPFKKEDVKDYFRTKELEGFPVLHHSKIVHEEYRPAYRIVAGNDISFK